MTGQFSLPEIESSNSATVLVDAMRSWRKARDGRHAVQPCLSRALEPHGCTMLSPVLDSLISFYEAALGHTITIGEGMALSEDELRLLDLVEGAIPRACIDCPEGAANALACALCSTRIMFALTLGPAASKRPSARRRPEPLGQILERAVN
jgi:hypothetical protein